jgi:Glycosyltransferase family 87
MAPGAWINLVLVVVAIIYGVQVVMDRMNNRFCLNLGVDYCAYWSAGQISNAHGYAGMYDQDLLIRYQAQLYPSPDDPAVPQRIIPFPYLPVFVLPFQLLALLDLKISFVLSTLLNLAGFILYLLWFTKQMTGRTLPVRLLLMCVLCTPMFLNLFWGQANIYLGICMGEFVRAYLNGKPWRAGLWLGGMLFKPLLLILILPVLLYQRSFKVLGGFLATLAGLLLISYAMIGTQGSLHLVGILSSSAAGGSASNPGIMMNWRMLGFHLTGFSSATLAWAVMILGTLLTVGATWLVARRNFLPDRTRTAAALLGIFAATGAVAWHAHFPQTIVLLSLFIYISLQSHPAERFFRIWVLTPIAITILTTILVVIAGISPSTVSQLQTGVTGLILNLVVLAWAVSFCRRGNLPDLSPIPFSDQA